MTSYFWVFSYFVCLRGADHPRNFNSTLDGKEYWREYLASLYVRQRNLIS